MDRALRARVLLAEAQAVGVTIGDLVAVAGEALPAVPAVPTVRRTGGWPSPGGGTGA